LAAWELVDTTAADLADATTADAADLATADLADATMMEVAGDNGVDIAPDVLADESSPPSEGPCFVSQLTWAGQADEEPLGWHPVVAALPSGRFLVAWTVSNMQGVPPNESGVRAAVFGKDGVALSDPGWVSAMPPIGVPVPNGAKNRVLVAPAGEDRFLVVWLEFRKGQQLLLSRFVGEDGSLLGEGETTMTVRETSVLPTGLAFRGDRKVLAWSEDEEAIFVQEVSAEGGLSGIPTRVDDPSQAADGEICTKQMAAADIFPDGSLYVVWAQWCGPADTACPWRHISGRWLDAELNAVGPVSTAIENNSKSQFLDLTWPQVVAFPDGFAAVVAIGPLVVVGNWVGNSGESGTPHLFSNDNEGPSAVTAMRLDNSTGLVLWDSMGGPLGGRMVAPPLEFVGPKFGIAQQEAEGSMTGTGPVTAAALDSDLFVVTYSYFPLDEPLQEEIRGKIFSRKCPVE
jgi:hypothetical protein